MQFRRPRAILLVTITAALLSGCLSTDTAITLREDGSGSIELVYTIDRSAWETGVFDDSDLARPVPVTRHEFEEAALLIEGLMLRSHRTSETDESVVVSARLDFASVDDLRRFLGSESLEVDPEAGLWHQTIAQGRGSGSPQAQSLAESLAGYELRFRLDPPRSVRSTNGEVIDAGAAAAFALPFAQIVETREPIEWEVRW
ncbi:MAG: hypothetical protein ACOC2Q_05340 [Spirochaetota bacterium]